jgi:hypothetical protein
VPMKPFTAAARNMLVVSHLLWTSQAESTPVIPHNEKRRYLGIFISAGYRFPFFYLAQPFPPNVCRIKRDSRVRYPPRSMDRSGSRKLRSRHEQQRGTVSTNGRLNDTNSTG